MTIIEFYDKTALENIAGAMLCDAKKIILVGKNLARMERSKVIYESILRNREITTQVDCVCMSRNNLQTIVQVLEQIVLSDENCVFDLTGGDDLYLVAVGTLMEKYKGRVQCHRFNFINNVLYDCDADGNVCSTLPFRISVDENINMYGGMIVRDENLPLHTYTWDLNDDFITDVDLMWDICKRDVGYWNVQTSILGGICEIIKIDERLELSTDYSTASNALYKKRIDIGEFIGFLYKLQQLGLINSLQTKGEISFTFKNRQVKHCLILPGRILELIIASRLRSIKDTDGNPMYHDVTVGAVIDWDRSDEKNAYRTINEIDVLAMKGAIPIFISCKNGNFDENELYKLSTVADRFGDKYAKKILVATKLEKFGLKSDYLRARMSDMGIRCIDNITNMTDSQLDATLKTLCLN